MSYVAIIYISDLEKRQPGLPFGMRSDRAFYYPIERPKPMKGELAKVELDAVVLKKGTNFVDASAWEAVNKHPANEIDLARLTKFNAISIHIPDNPQQAAKDTTDFADESVVQELVESSNDLEWLRLCLNVDRRIPIRKLISDRIKDIDEEISAMRQRMSVALT